MKVVRDIRANGMCEFRHSAGDIVGGDEDGGRHQEMIPTGIPVPPDPPDLPDHLT
jgi:hypothetical protein